MRMVQVARFSMTSQAMHIPPSPQILSIQVMHKFASSLCTLSWSDLVLEHACETDI